MQVSNPNNVKIYNLSAGRSLPEWLSDRRKRKLQQNDSDIQRRIELLQDFEMPTVSSCVQMSPDGQYVCVTGTYKPRFRCYDVHQMSMKFERGLDAEVIKFSLLADDYSKVIFLQDDRYVEFHTQFGRLYRTRIPKYGRDLAYHFPSCDLYFVGIGPEIYRLNLERGCFLKPLSSNASEINCCEFNPVHQLFACGTKEGCVECWDPRTRKRSGILDTALGHHIPDLHSVGLPSVTALKYKDGLSMAVGTSTGHVLLYDLRSDKPLLVKDHQYELPIQKLEFNDSLDLVLSMDSRILKLWNRLDGKPYTAVEPGTILNDLCQMPGSGLLFMANDAPKMLTYYIPSLGTAPKWCYFLDNLTEELEENNTPTVYDDYKFLDRKELEELGLSHLIGSNLLRAYMHGFFIDVRLYHKAKSIADPFAYEAYRRAKVQQKIEEERNNRVQVKKLPKVNRALAEKLLASEEDTQSKKKSKIPNLLEDDRFASMFTNPDFQVDETSDEYRLLNPVIARKEKSREKANVQSDSEDEETATKQAPKIFKHKWLTEEEEEAPSSEPQIEMMKDSFSDIQIKGRKSSRKIQKKSLGDRLEERTDDAIVTESLGNKEMTFVWKKKSDREHKKDLETAKHKAERRQLHRSAATISSKFKSRPKFWMGKRVQ